MTTGLQGESTAAVHSYMLNYFNARESLVQARNEQRERARNQQISESDQATAAAAFLDLVDKIAQLEDVHSLILEKYNGVILAPDDQLVLKSRQLSEKLAATLASANRAVVVLAAVTSFINGWTSILNDAAAAPVATEAPPRRDAAALAVERTLRATNMEFLGVSRNA